MYGEQGHRRIQHLSAFVRILLCECQQGSGGKELRASEINRLAIRNDNGEMNNGLIMLIEQNTSYAREIKNTINLSFDKIGV